MSNRSGMDRPGNSDHLEDELNLAAGIRHRLGEMLLQAGRISHDVLVSAIAEQRQRGEKLGRVLLRLGLDIGELDVALEFQQRQDAGAPGFGLLRLGEIMVSTGQITREQMAASLSRQRLSGKKFGEVLVATGLAEPQQIAHTLQIQQKMVTAALVAALALGGISSSSNAAPGDAQLPVHTTTLKKNTSIKFHSQPDEFSVTDADIERGHVDIPEPVSAMVRNSNPGGYMLLFENNGKFLHQTQIRGLGDEIRFDGRGGVITRPGYLPGKEENPVELMFSFVLSDHARPGTYDWPVRISALPL